ncbi:MAG: ABC-type amino acid transport substrate-binding protein [Cellvibrionaceae bacterium]
MKNRRFQQAVIAMSLFLTGLLLLNGCRPSGKTLERIQANGIIRVGLDPTFPPFENGDTGTLEGIDIDLAYAIGREMGVAVEFVLLGYDGLYDALLINQCDILISALIVDNTKTKDFAYTEPYFNAGQVLIVHEKNNATEELSDLEGQVIVVETGSEGHVQALSAQNQVKKLKIKTVPTAADALWIVLQGEADGALVDQVNARLYIQAQPNLKIVPKPVTVEPYGVVTRKDDNKLMAELNRVLNKLETSGELSQIVEKWLDGTKTTASH